MSFKIYYGDGTIFEGGYGGLPAARDVQVILQEGENGAYFQSGSDYYVWKDGRWLGVDIFGLFDFLIDSGLVLFGRTITNVEYQAVLKTAKVEKTTWQPGERRP